VPAAIVAKLETEIVAALRDPDVNRRLQDSGATVVAQTGAAFDAANRAQTATFAAIFKKLDLKPD
jgi:tripartite-type tricarboxylate transporter receptor subunit TctC